MHRLHVVTGTCRHHFGCPYYLNPRQQAHIWSASCLCFNVAHFSLPRGYSGYKFSTRRRFWKISVQILMDQANPTSWTSKQWRWNREWPWFWALCEIHKPMTLGPPSICLGPLQESNWEIWQTCLSILKAWSEPEFVITILPSGNPIDMHSITFFFTGEVETTSKIGPGWSNWNVHGVSNPWIL